MSKGLKIAGGIVLALILLLFAAPFVIPKHLYLDWVIQAIESRYPVKLSVGDAHLGLMPTPRIHLKAIKVNRVGDDGSESKFLTADGAAVSFDWSIRPDVKKALESLDGVELEQARLFFTNHELDIDGKFEVAAAPLMETDVSKESIRLSSEDFSLRYDKSVDIKEQPLKLELSFKRQPEQDTIKVANLQLGPQQLTADVIRKPELITIDFKAQQLSLNYLKSILKGLDKIPPFTGASAKGKMTIQTKPETELTVHATVRAQELTLEGNTLKNISSQLQYQERDLRFSELKTEILGGTVQGSAQLNFASKEPRFDVDFQVNNVAVGRIGDVGQMMTGLANLKIKAKGQGMSAAALKNNLSGSGNLKIHQIKLKKLKFFQPLMALSAWNPVHKVIGTVNPLNHKKAAELDKEARSITSRFSIGGAKVRFPNIKIDYPGATVTASGQVGFDDILNFHGSINMTRSLTADLLGKSLGEEELLAVPVSVTGTIQNPKIHIDNNFLASKLKTIVTLPLTITKGILTAPFRLFKRSDKKEEEPVSDQGDGH